MDASADDLVVRFLVGLAGLGRADAFAVRLPTGAYRPVRRPMMESDVRAHLGGRSPAGIYIVTGDRAHLGVIDLDSHDATVEWTAMVSKAKSLATWLRERGYIVLAVRSGGGAGIHLFVPFSGEQSANDIKRLLTACVESCELKVGTGGVAKGEAEVFPKQSVVRSNGLGNLIALPLARASHGIRSDSFESIKSEHLAADGLAPFLNSKNASEFATSEVQDNNDRSVTRILSAAPKVSKLQPLPGDRGIAADALRSIPADSYGNWILVGFALKTAFGEIGFETWLQWSKSSGTKFAGEEECRRKWDGFPLRSEVGLGTVFHLARTNGWNGGDSDDWVREMNAQYGILTHATDTLIILKQHDAEHEVFGRLGSRQLHDRLASEVIQMPGPRGAPIFKPKSKAWFEHPNASRYDRLIFDPSLPPGENGSAWNMWTGFAFDPAPGDWSLLKDHIRQVICGGDTALYEWMFNWMADGVQKPGDVIGTAPVFVGLPGTGKSFLARAYGRLWGRHFVTITNHDHVHGRFTGHLIGRRVIFVDEGTFGGNRKEAGTLKTRVTEDMIMHELKGVDPIFMPNRTIWLIASNEKSVVPADKADRRWQLFDVSSEKREDHAYFAAIQQQLDSGGYAAMLHELLSRDLSKGPDPRTTIKTEALFDQMIRAQGPEERYLARIFDEGRLPQNYVSAANSTTIKAMHEDLRASEVDGNRVHMNGFGRLLQSVIPGIKTRRGGKYHIKDSIFAVSVEYAFPPLSDCRVALERYLRCPIPWSNQLTEWQQDPSPGGPEKGVL